MLSVLITEELIQEIVGGGPAFSSAHIWPQQSLARPAETLEVPTKAKFETQN